MRGNEVLAVSAASNVKFTLSVDGFSEAGTALNNLEKPADWNQSSRLICEYRQQAVDRVNTALSKVLASEAQSAAPNVYTPRGDRGTRVARTARGLYRRHGANRDGVRAGPPSRGKRQPCRPSRSRADARNRVRAQGGDRQRNLQRSRRSMSACRRRAAAACRSRKPSTQGVRRLLALLEQRPNDIELKWFLNAAFMATGGYPGARAAEASDRDDAPSRRPKTSGDSWTWRRRRGSIRSHRRAALSIDDFDNDGRLEILTSNFDSCGRMQLFRRRADGVFEDRAEQAGLAEQLGGLNLSQADYNNDGCKDVLVMRGGWELAQRRSLLRNNCDGTFTDVTAAAGLQTPVTSSQTAVWTDIDNDGWMDLFVGNEDAPLQLFRNRGNGTLRGHRGRGRRPSHGVHQSRRRGRLRQRRVSRTCTSPTSVTGTCSSTTTATRPFET